MDFPTESHTNGQWWYLLSGADALPLEHLPRELRPIVQVIDDCVTNRRLGLLIEASVDRGKLMVCSIDLENGLDANPFADQMRACLLRYMARERSKPAGKITVGQVRSIIND